MEKVFVVDKRGDWSAYRIDEAGQELVLKNMGLVKSVIRDRFSVYHEYYDDMLQEGTIGLIKAVAKHDPSRGAQLSTFGYLCIKNEVQKFVSECTDTIKVPTSVGLAINGMRKVDEKNGTDEERQEVLKHNGISKEMLEAGKTALATVSMDDEAEDGLYYSDIIAGKPVTDGSQLEIEEKELYNDLHNWLNWNFEDELYDNRVYINYLYMVESGYYKISEVYMQLQEIYDASRGYVRKLINRYTPRMVDFLKYRKSCKV